MMERPLSDLSSEAVGAHTAIPERRRAVVVLHFLLALLLKIAQLCRHHIFTTCIENWLLNLRVGVLLARAMLRFTCYYARIMLDAFALVLHCIPQNILA